MERRWLICRKTTEPVLKETDRKPDEALGHAVGPMIDSKILIKVAWEEIKRARAEAREAAKAEVEEAVEAAAEEAAAGEIKNLLS